jgi:hypothetical protein
VTFGGHIQARFTVPSSQSIETTSTAGGTDTVNLTAASYYLGNAGSSTPAFIAAFQTLLQAVDASWTVSLSTTTGKVSIACDGTWSITWTSTNLRDLLGFTANISSVTGTQTGTNHARGLWIPDCPIFLDGNYLAAPSVTDQRQTESPDGLTITLVGNRKYRHRNVRYANVAAAKTWVGSESTTHESLERFLVDTQWGLGHTWFSAGSKCRIATHVSGETQLGNGTVDGWYLNGCRSMEEIVTRASGQWDGLWTVAIPTLTTNS